MIRTGMLATVIFLGSMAFGSSVLVGQEPSPGAAAPETPAANADDVRSVDAILTALYEVISGPAGEARDWDRFRSLFREGARLVPAQTAPDGTVRIRVLSPEDYIQLAGPNLEASGFFEREIGRTEERFGNIVHAFSAYDSRRSADDPEPFARGINSIQLVHDGERWWVVTILWDAERPDNPIPDELLEG